MRGSIVVVASGTRGGPGVKTTMLLLSHTYSHTHAGAQFLSVNVRFLQEYSDT